MKWCLAIGFFFPLTYYSRFQAFLLAIKYALNQSFSNQINSPGVFIPLDDDSVISSLKDGNSVNPFLMRIQILIISLLTTKEMMVTFVTRGVPDQARD